MSDKKIILFDDVCLLCSRAVLFIIKNDPNRIFTFVSIESEKASQLLKEVFHNKRIDSLILIDGKNVYTKSSAILYIAKSLSGPVKYCYYGIFLPRKLRDFLYTLITKYRYSLFGKAKSCFTPPETMKDRFLW